MIMYGLGKKDSIRINNNRSDRAKLSITAHVKIKIVINSKK
jgi:hypothetical protein